jgi:hypothetical protein
MACRRLSLALAIPLALAMGTGPAQADGLACGSADAAADHAVTDRPSVFTEGLTTAIRQTCRALAHAADATEPPTCRIETSGAVGTVGVTETHYALYCLGPQSADGACTWRGAALFLEDRANGRITRFLTRLDEPRLHAGAPSIRHSGGDIVLELPVAVSGAAFDDNDVFVFEQDHWMRLDTLCWQDDLARRLPHGLYIDTGAIVNLERLDAEVWLSRDGDPECCPTGGLAHVTLKRTGGWLSIESLRIDPQARPE